MNLDEIRCQLAAGVHPDDILDLVATVERLQAALDKLRWTLLPIYVGKEPVASKIAFEALLLIDTATDNKER